MRRALPSLLLVVGAAACDVQLTTPPGTDAWVGRWNGPEGTYLEIAGKNGAYAITVKDLDVARTFDGVVVGDRIEFRRDGTSESLRASNGDATGMKWLAGKKNCLTIKPGEGYCRD
jgi:hypothetical protein